MRLPIRPLSARSGRRGQTIVEFALVAPVFILLLLITIDVGRVFLGWVALNNAARVGANYAAANPNEAWAAGSDYQALIDANINAINCDRNPAIVDPPTFGPTREPGDAVTVGLSCDFAVLTPGVEAILGGTVTVSSSSTFPITYGCLADCPSGPPATPPPPPEDNCRTIPDVIGMSVAGARAAWVAAGFSASEFHPTSGDDTRTVETRTVTEPTNDEGCTGNEAFFAASMTVTLEDLGPVTSPTCIYVPNLRGVTVAVARQAWTDVGFTGAFPPTGNDTRVVIEQITDPASSPGDCVEPDTSVTVSHGPPPGPPPPPPCMVPSFVNTSSAAASGTWTGAGFDAANLSFSRGGTFTILSQSLVGGTYVSCDADILLSHRAGNNP